MKKTILIVIAHSDDETISMGATIRKHIENGDDVFVTSMTDGVSSRKKTTNIEINERKKSSINASKILGFKWIKNYKFKDNELDKHSLLEIVNSIEDVKKIVKPNMVYTHCGGDLNIDHRIIANAVLTAFRPQPAEICKEIRLFEVPSATDYGHNSITGQFIPNLYVSIGDKWKKKEEALKAYQKEMRQYPHSRSIEGIKNLARYRGSQIGVDLAEAFEVIRKLDE